MNKTVKLKKPVEMPFDGGKIEHITITGVQLVLEAKPPVARVTVMAGGPHMHRSVDIPLSRDEYLMWRERALEAVAAKFGEFDDPEAPDPEPEPETKSKKK